jgi:hypothetical protein
MTAHVRIPPRVDDFDIQVDISVYSSLFRVIESAPIERKPALFSLLCKSAAGEIATRRQQAIDDLHQAACDIGLDRLIGVSAVQDFIGCAFAQFETGRAA